MVTGGVENTRDIIALDGKKYNTPITTLLFCNKKRCELSDGFSLAGQLTKNVI